MRCILIIVILAMGPQLLVAAEPLRLHVAPAGNNNWSGRLGDWF